MRVKRVLYKKKENSKVNERMKIIKLSIITVYIYETQHGG